MDPVALVDVRIEFVRPGASRVFLAGSFNDWRPTATPMVLIADGRWIKQLRLPPGRYEYRFIVDGEWITDPEAPEQTPNPYGGCNSVLWVRSQD